MKPLFALFALFAVPLFAEELPSEQPAIYPNHEGVYRVGDWKYSYLVIWPRTKSQGCWGRLYYQGKELTAPENAVVSTPVGIFLFLGGLEIQGWGEHGWFNTLRDYSGNCSPVFDNDGRVQTTLSGPIKKLSTAELLNWNKCNFESSAADKPPANSSK